MSEVKDVKVETIQMDNNNFQPKQGEVFFSSIETDKRKYIVSLRRKTKEENVIVLSESLLPTMSNREGEEGTLTRNKPHKLRIYEEAIDAFLIALTAVKTKIEQIKNETAEKSPA